MTERRFRVVASLAIGLMGLLAYANTLDNQFVWDDASSILVHQHVQDPGSLFKLFAEDQHAFAGGQGNFYRPLLSASFMLDFALSHSPLFREKWTQNIPVSPLIFHLSNMAWHIGAALLLFLLLCRAGAPRFVQAMVPLVWVVHPLHTEAVTYISGRGDSMAAVFVFAALWFALRESSRDRRPVDIGLSVLFFVAGLLSKEAASVYPFLLLLFSAFLPASPEPEERRTSSALRAAPLGAAGLVLVIYVILRMTVLDFAPDRARPAVDALQQLVQAGQSLTLYLLLIVAPAGLHMQRDLDGVSVWAAGVGCAALVGFAALISYGLRKGQYRLVLGLGWFIVSWLPISGLFPLNAPMAEHWLYIPLAGLLWSAAEGVWLLAERRPAAGWAAAAVAYVACACFIGLCVERNRDWRDNQSIYLSTVDGNPEATFALYNLAVTYEDLQGNPPVARRYYEELLETYKRQKQARLAKNPQTREEFLPGELDAHLSLGSFYLKKAEYGKALQHFAVPAERLDPGNERSDTYIGSGAFGLGQCLLAIGDVTKASEQFERAVGLRPELKTEARQAMTGGTLYF